MSASKVFKTLPKVLVFDLDGCVWRPEMYELWGGGGAPFKSVNNGDYLLDRGGERVELIADVRSILNELKTDSKWKDSIVSVASSCDEPRWADECIEKFDIGGGAKLKDLFQHRQIYKRSKSHHLKAIAKATGVSLKDMIFFDNEYRNCKTVAGIGVTVLYTPDGVYRKDFEEALEKFPSPGEVLGPKRRGYW